MDFTALIEANKKVINRSYSDAIDGKNVNYSSNIMQNEYMSKRNAVGHVAEQLDRARIAREEAARTRAYNNRNKK